MLVDKTEKLNPFGIYNRCPVCRELYLLVICVKDGESKPAFYHEVCSWCEEVTPLKVKPRILNRRRMKYVLSRQQENEVHRIGEDESRVVSPEFEN